MEKENWENWHQIVLKACLEDNCYSAEERESCGEEKYINGKELENKSSEED
jgi:hypothetical protein